MATAATGATATEDVLAAGAIAAAEYDRDLARAEDVLAAGAIEHCSQPGPESMAAAAPADDGVEGGGGGGGPHPIPLDFVCPITQELMRDPTIALDGHSYERDAIVHWFEKSGTNKSPLTGVSLESSHLTPNHTLRKGELTPT
jgi:hypothetical protein